MLPTKPVHPLTPSLPLLLLLLLATLLSLQQQSASNVPAKNKADFRGLVDTDKVVEDFNRAMESVKRVWGQRKEANHFRGQDEEKAFLLTALEELLNFERRLQQQALAEPSQDAVPSLSQDSLPAGSGQTSETMASKVIKKFGDLVETDGLDLSDDDERPLILGQYSQQRIKTITVNFVKDLMRNELKHMALVLIGIHTELKGPAGLEQIKHSIMIKVVEFLVTVFIQILSQVFGRPIQPNLSGSSLSVPVSTTENPVNRFLYTMID